MKKQMPNHVGLVPKMKLMTQIKQAALNGNFKKVQELQKQLKNIK
jgi:hypothetical protein